MSEDEGKKKRALNPEGKGSTTTNIELRERLSFVAELLASPLAYREVIEAICAEHNVQERQAKRYIAKVFAQWEADGRAEREATRERQIRRILKQIAKHESKAPAIAFRYESLLARILGTLAPVRVLNVDEVDVGALTDEQLRRIAAGEDPAAVVGSQSGSVH